MSPTMDVKAAIQLASNFEAKEFDKATDKVSKPGQKMASLGTLTLISVTRTRTKHSAMAS